MNFEWLEQNQKWLEANYSVCESINQSGAVAKRLGSGLQNHLDRFNSDPHLQLIDFIYVFLSCEFRVIRKWELLPKK